jgi:hypothetical protein
MIEATQIATMRYAPEGASAVNLYSTETASGLTLGQLVIAVCLKTAASYEAQSVNKMNLITKNAERIEAGAQWVERLANGAVSWVRAKAFLVDSLGVDPANLPTTISTYSDRFKAITAANDKLNSLLQTQQEDMVDMQSYVSRRDAAFSASSNIIRALGRSMNGLAEIVAKK